MILKGKNIIVTGSEGLLGKEIVADIQKEGGNAIRLDISHETYPETHQYKVDLTHQEETENTIFKLIKTYNHIDGLVNNAYPRTKDWGTKMEEVALTSFRQNVDWQLNSIFHLIQLISIHMTGFNQGSVVNIASIYGIIGSDFTLYNNTNLTSPVAYSAIKGGLINMNRYLASYFGKNNLRFNCVSPGGIQDKQPDEFIKNYNNKVPLRRMGTPEDIAPLVSFLLSEKSKYITGQNIAIDGGWTAI
jgi:NAD(P)-dependent dehydrogenase (short-subunit alcohol dehydrogenase family)